MGDYFNDLQAPRAPAFDSEPRMIPMFPPPLQEYGTPYWPVKTEWMDPVAAKRATPAGDGQVKIAQSAPGEEAISGAEKAAFASFRYSPEPRMWEKGKGDAQI